MTDTRERDIVRAFDLSNERVDGYDIVELLVRLTTNCAQLLDVARPVCCWPTSMECCT
jgi:hypothetical protein